MRRLVVLLVAAAGLAETAIADERSASVLRAFQDNCWPALPSFEAMVARASERKLPVQRGSASFPQGEDSVASIVWSAEDAVGAYEIAATRVAKGDEVATSCQIIAANVLVNELRAGLVGAMQLGEPFKEYFLGWHATGTRIWRKVVDGREIGVVLISHHRDENVARVELVAGYKRSIKMQAPSIERRGIPLGHKPNAK